MAEVLNPGDSYAALGRLMETSFPDLITKPQTSESITMVEWMRSLEDAAAIFKQQIVVAHQNVTDSYELK